MQFLNCLLREHERTYNAIKNTPSIIKSTYTKYMRLTTLARKIDKTPNQLIAFLDEKGIDTSGGLHGKLEDDIVAMVLDIFLPEPIPKEVSIPDIDEENVTEEGELSPEDVPKQETVQEDIKESDVSAEEPIPDSSEIVKVDIPVIVEETIKKEKTGTVDDLELENSDEIELIKAKKVKLEGIKVVGKIELHEKPSKTVEETKETEEKSSIKRKEERPNKISKSDNRKIDKRKKTVHRKKIKTLSYEERIKNEEREKLKLRRRRENKEKERKKKYYLKNIQPKTSQKPKSKKNKTSTIQVQTEKVLAHKNPFQKLWAWLNGKYDRY